MAPVTLSNVAKRFPGMARPAVGGCTLEVRDREFMVLVGPSGCGKTTLLRLVAGLEVADAGEIAIGGRRVNDVAPQDRGIAMVFQNYALYPHMNVYRNMAFGLLMARRPRAEIDARVREAAAMLGIADLLDRRPKALSGGQRQRVAVGRAIVSHKEVFLFDEPLSNLDARLRVQMRAELKKLHRRLAATMIYVTHDQTEAMTMGDRICVMRDGLVQQVGPPLEIYREPANVFVAGFIGSPPMNFLDGQIVEEHGDRWFRESGGEGGIQFALAGAHVGPLKSLEGRALTLGIRPEDVTQATRPGEGRAWRPFEATVEIVEPMGAETVVYLTTGRHALTARVEGTVKLPEPGQRFKLYLDAGRAHYFDRASEARIV